MAKKRKRKKRKDTLPRAVRIQKALKGPCPFKAKTWDGKRKSKKQRSKEECRRYKNDGDSSFYRQWCIGV